MRDTRRCPKCQHGQVIRLARVAGELVYMRRPPGATGAPGQPTWRRAGPREAYVCRACGFTEYYTLDLDTFQADDDLVAILTSEGEGPYR